MKRFAIKILAVILRKKGYTEYMGLELTKDILKDLFRNKQNTIREKLWAYKRGFLSAKINQYGLTEDNYKLFVSDFEYYRLYPINSEFSKWIDDKITTRYILQPYEEYLPKYYFHIKNKEEILPLFISDHKYNTSDIIDLLIKEKDLALKLISGSYGLGFYKFSYKNNNFHINGYSVDRTEIDKLLSNLDNYLVTEYITAHADIRKIYSHAPNTLRVMIINEHGIEPVIAGAFIRFGTKATGVIDNGAAGGIISIIDIENGRYSDPKRMVDNHIVKCEIHPDSKSEIEGVLPHWESVKIKLIEISKYISEVRYMGVDIVITEDGFKILEINSHQGIVPFQFYYPLLANKEAATFFKKLLKQKER